jgi:hypothetical protein
MIGFGLFYNNNQSSKQNLADNKNNNLNTKSEKLNFPATSTAQVGEVPNLPDLKSLPKSLPDLKTKKESAATTADLNVGEVLNLSDMSTKKTAKKWNVLAKNATDIRNERNAEGNESREFSRGTQNPSIATVITKNEGKENASKTADSVTTKVVATKSATEIAVLNTATKVAAPSVITYFKKHFPKKANGERYVFNTATDTLFTTPQGTVIALPKNVFATTEPRLTLTVKEAYTYGDMLLHQLTTVADNDNLMETGGMLYLQVTDKNNKEVPLKPNKTIKVQMPSTNLKADMQSFYQSKTDKAEVFENAAAWSAASAGNLEKKNVEKRKLAPYFWWNSKLNVLN